MSEEKKTFKTDNLGLFAYLDLHGLKKIDSEVTERNGRIVIFFIFDDPLGQGDELRRAYVRSTENEYRRLIHHYRREIQEILEDYKKKKKEI
jgi:hypothetical protein